MSKFLEVKHKEAIDKKDFWQSHVDGLIDKIKVDESGACWHIEEAEAFTRKEAERLDAMPLDERVKQPLWGLSVGVKDLFAIKGLRTTAGSKMLENFISPYDSTVWSSLKKRGALMGAKLSMDEFAMGSFTNTSPFGRASVPGYPEHTAGGSSGGSGSALAAGLVDFTIGSDTGGSVRLPAAFCGTWGYKPSYGAFSRHGMIAYASSLDQAGFLTNGLEDLMYLLESGVSDKCSNDYTSLGLDLSYERSVSPKGGKRIAYIPSLLDADGISDDVKKEYQAFLNRENSSFNYDQLIPVEIPLMKEAASIYYIIACSEAASNLARFQGVYFGPQLVEQGFDGNYWDQCAQYRSKFFGEEVQKRLMLGAYITSSENFGTIFKKAQALRSELTRQINAVLEHCDMLVLPTSPFKAPKWDDIAKMSSAEIYMSDFLTVPFSLAGVPVVNVPIKRDNLAVGLQFVGKKMKDYQLLKDMSELG